METDKTIAHKKTAMKSCLSISSPIISKYTALEPDQASYVAQPRLRGFNDLDATDLDSYQKFIDVFVSEEVLEQEMAVKDLMLDKSELG